MRITSYVSDEQRRRRAKRQAGGYNYFWALPKGEFLMNTTPSLPLAESITVEELFKMGDIGPCELIDERLYTYESNRY